MENLTLYDPLRGSQADGPMSPDAPHHHPAPAAPPLMLHQAPVPQLPPQMFTTAAQLLDLTDKKLMVALRDGRKFIGVLRSWDQFANLILQSTVERIFAPFPPSKPASSPGVEAGSDAATPRPLGLFADYARGLYLVRGENVLLLGEIDLDKDDDVPVGYLRGDPDVVERMAAEHKAAVKVREAARLRCLAKFGFEGEYVGDVLI